MTDAKGVYLDAFIQGGRNGRLGLEDAQEYIKVANDPKKILALLTQWENRGLLPSRFYTNRFLTIWRAFGGDLHWVGCSSDQISQALRSSGYGSSMEGIPKPSTSLKLYRGADRSHPLGLSWSPSMGYASIYSQRNRLYKGNGVLSSIVAQPADILAIIQSSQSGDWLFREYLVDTSWDDLNSVSFTCISSDHPSVISGAYKELTKMVANAGDEKKPELLKLLQYVRERGDMVGAW